MPQYRNTLAGHSKVRPYSQGSLSGLCGLYAAINAARLICPEHAGQRELWSDLYQDAVSELGRQRMLTGSLIEGLGYELWKTLQHAMYDELSERLGCLVRMQPLVRRKRRRSADPSSFICQAIDMNRAVLCALCGTHEHYTVIAGYTPARWLLHDSTGMRWVERKATSIGQPGGTRHWIPFTSLVMLYRKELPS